MANMIDIGISSLLAYQDALNVASNNIANANDTSFARREANFAENQGNSGVNVADVSRVVDANSIQYAQASNTNYSQMNTYATQLQSLVSLFSSNTTGIGASIITSLATLEDLSATPADSGSRTNYIASLGTIAQQFQSVSGQITTGLQQVNQSLTTDASEVNQILSNIASVNQQIQNAPGQDNSSLLDERDGLLDNLSNYMDFTTEPDSQGMIDVSLSNGMRVVSGITPSQIQTFNDPSNSQNLLIGLANGSSTMDLTNIIKSGQIAGLYNFRQDAQQAQTSINRLSLAVSQSFNQQNQLGILPNGNFGTDLYNDINSTTAINDRVITNEDNTGTGSFTVNISNVGQLQASDYQFTVGAGNSYVLKRLSDNTVVSSGTISGVLPQTLSVDGFQLNINSGTFNAGDQYLISPTKDAAASMGLATTDGAQLALAWPVTTSSNKQNAGNGALSVQSITDPTNPALSTPQQLSPPLIVQFDSTGSNYSILNAQTNAVLAGPIAYNPATTTTIIPAGGYDPGYQIAISGTPKANDSFNINFNSANSTDFSNGTAMQKLYSQQILNNGVSTFNQDYDATATTVFTAGQSAQNQSDVAQKISAAATTARDDISGVSVPEESMNIERFQEAYQASAQVLQSAKATFEMLIGMFST